MRQYKEDFNKKNKGITWEYQNQALEDRYKAFADKQKKNDAKYQEEKSTFEKERAKWNPPKKIE